MVDKELYASYEKALGSVFELVQRDCMNTMNQIEVMSKRYNLGYTDTLRLIESKLCNINNKYGKVAAQAALEFYERCASDSSSEADFSPTTYTTPNRFVTQDLKDAVSELASKEDIFSEAFMRGCATKAQSYAAKSADATLLTNARRDPNKPKWALVPHFGACPWCLMIASNGFTWNEGHIPRHNHCTCTAIVDFDTKNPRLQDYDPQGIYDRMKKIAKDDGLEDTDWTNILDGAKFRSREWLRTGKTPTYGYDNETTKAFKSRDKKHALEIKTANKLAKHGFECVFVTDAKKDTNASRKTIGLPDLKNGIEIKTMYQAKTFSTFDKYVRKGLKKDGIKAFVFDVSENGYISDSNAYMYISSTLKNRGWIKSWVINHEGQLVPVIKEGG